MKHFTLLLTLVLFTTVNGMSQDYALFIHGFEGGEESWLGSGTPDDWVSAGIIDDYVVISYDTIDLISQSDLESLVISIASEMAAITPHGDWVIVGHSLGGLLARLFYDQLKMTPGVNIKSILTIGTPHQGARAAHVSLGTQTGYINVEPQLDQFVYRVSRPINEEIYAPVTSIITSFTHPGAISTLEGLITALPVFADSLLRSYEQPSVLNNVKGIIGVEGAMIQHINSWQVNDPPYKRSVIGSEKHFILPRTANEVLEGGTGNELHGLNNFNDARSFYQAHRDEWHYLYIGSCVFTLGLGCIFDNSLKNKRDRWQRGKDELDDIDGTWGVMIDSYVPEYHTTTTWVYVGCGGGSGPGPIIENPHQPVINPLESLGDPDCDGWEPVTNTEVVLVPTKNDALIGPNYAVWNPNDNPGDGATNWYYNDVPADGGYNHFELRRHKRAYTLPGVFQQGDLAPPMEQAADWLRFIVFERD